MKTVMMIRSTRLATLLIAVTAPAAVAQSLANRVDAAPAGPVQFSFAARPGVCGNGRNFYSTAPGSYTGTFTDGVRAEPCVPGPVRVVIDRADKLPLSIATYVGPADTTLRGITDLGRIRAQDAAAYLLSLANTVDGRAGRDAISPATLADSANIANALVAIAKNDDVARDTRRRALDALGRLSHGDGVTLLIPFVQQGESPWLARDAMQTLANSGDPRARQFVRSSVKRTDLPDDVFRIVLRTVGQTYGTAQDMALLIQLYDTTTDPKLKQTLIGIYAENGERLAVDKLIHIAKADENPSIRRSAINQLSRSSDPRVKQALADIVTRS